MLSDVEKNIAMLGVKSKYGIFDILCISESCCYVETNENFPLYLYKNVNIKFFVNQHNGTWNPSHFYLSPESYSFDENITYSSKEKIVYEVLKHLNKLVDPRKLNLAEISRLEHEVGKIEESYNVNFIKRKILCNQLSRMKRDRLIQVKLFEESSNSYCWGKLVKHNRGLTNNEAIIESMTLTGKSIGDLVEVKKIDYIHYKIVDIIQKKEKVLYVRFLPGKASALLKACSRAGVRCTAFTATTGAIGFPASMAPAECQSILASFSKKS